MSDTFVVESVTKVCNIGTLNPMSSDQKPNVRDKKFSHAGTTVTVTQHPFVELSQILQAQGSIQIQQTQMMVSFTQCLHLGYNIQAPVQQHLP